MNSTELYIFSMNFVPTSRHKFLFPRTSWNFDIFVLKIFYEWLDKLYGAETSFQNRIVNRESIVKCCLWRRQIQAKLSHFCVCGFISKWQIYAEKKKETINVRLSENVTVRHSAVFDAAPFSSFSKSFLWIFLVCLVGLVVYGVVRCI